jgi:hypothetical protein
MRTVSQHMKYFIWRHSEHLPHCPDGLKEALPILGSFCAFFMISLTLISIESNTRDNHKHHHEPHRQAVAKSDHDQSSSITYFTPLSDPNIHDTIPTFVPLAPARAHNHRGTVCLNSSSCFASSH